MEEPVLHYRFPLNDPQHPLGEWADTGDHLVWHVRLSHDQPPLEVWERRSQGFVKLPVKPHSLNLIEAGVPHHIEHLFGFWRVSDADTIWLRSIQTDGAYHVMILGGRDGANLGAEAFWCCPSCGRDLVRHAYVPGDGSADDFWKTQLDHVRAFNADVSARTCTDCGTVHPSAYGFDSRDDDETEAAARRDGWNG